MIFHKSCFVCELELVQSFLNLLYSNIPRREECDKMRWRLRGHGGCTICTMRLSEVQQLILYIWKSIWCVKALRGPHSFFGQQPRGRFLPVIILSSKVSL